MFDYTVLSQNSQKKFNSICDIIENAFPYAKKHRLLVDVDGTTIQTFTVDGKDIDVYDDYDVCSVYIKSAVDLKHIFQ